MSWLPSRGNVVLALLFVMLLALDWNTRPTASRGALDAPLVPELFGVLPWRIELAAGGQSLVLEREALDPEADPKAFGPWTLPDMDGYAAEPAAVDRLLSALRSLRTLDVVSSSGKDRATFGLGPDAMSLRVSGAESALRPERVLANLVLGRSEAQIPHVMRRDGDDVVRIAGFPWPGLEPSSWVAADWLAFEPSWVQSVELRLPDGSEGAVLRAGLDRWESAQGERVSAQAMGEFLWTLRELKPRSARATQLLPEDLATWQVTLRLEGGEATQVQWILVDDQRTLGDPAQELAMGYRNGDSWVVEIPVPAYHALLSQARGLLP